jgi:hypothetical protein
VRKRVAAPRKEKRSGFAAVPMHCRCVRHVRSCGMTVDGVHVHSRAAVGLAVEGGI